MIYADVQRLIRYAVGNRLIEKEDELVVRNLLIDALGIRDWIDEPDDGRDLSVDEILKRDKTSLDVFWVKDKSLADLDNLPDPDELAADIIDNLQSALDGFNELLRLLNK